MKVTELCNIRRLSPFGISTPLIIPSFSSKGFPTLKAIHTAMRPFITRISLVSAFDIAKGFLNSDAAYASDLVFIDSGGYEAKTSFNPMEAYQDLKYTSNWSFEEYDKILYSLQPKSDIVFVSFDLEMSLPLFEQLTRSLELFHKYPQFAGAFLWKPEGSHLFIGDEDELGNYTDELRQISILGVTDEELGASLIDRCKKIAEIRSVLSSSGLNTPIHIFGCIDPLRCILFFLCGADMFDGLAWLRYDFHGNSAYYLKQSAIRRCKAEFKDAELIMDIWSRNLSYFTLLRQSMVDFVANHNHATLLLTPNEWNQITAALEASNLSLSEVK